LSLRGREAGGAAPIVQQQTQHQYDKQRAELEEKNLKRVGLLVFLSPLLLAPLPLVALPVHVSMEPAPEEHVEYVVSIEFFILLMISLLISLSHLFLAASLIINCTFSRVTQANECLADLFECLLRLRVPVLVRMHLQRGLLICLLDILLCARALGNPQYLVVVLLP
jgi:hypothetical protein